MRNVVLAAVLLLSSASFAGAVTQINARDHTCGEIAQIMHLPFLAELRGTFELAALCDISPGVLSHCGERFNVPPERRYASAASMDPHRTRAARGSRRVPR